jgi:hypothetical protein
MIYRLSFAWLQLQKTARRQNAAQLLFLSCLHSEKEVGMQLSLVTMSCPFLRTVAPPPCLSLKKDGGLLIEELIEDWWRID